ncbi:MAG: two-component regulator propeller domain-containing protein [Acidobacteriota bacterium]
MPAKKRVMTRNTSLVIAGLALAAGLSVRVGAVKADQPLTGYSLTSWTDGDGVPLGTVYTMGQDADGYLWIGADAGLLRFDGLRFTHWDVLSDDALPRSSVTALCVARDGSLWVGFADGGGVRRLRNGRIADGQPRGRLGSTSDLVEDAHGVIWAVSDGTLYRLHDAAWQKLMPVWEGRAPGILHPSVDRRGQLLVGTTRGLFRRVGETDGFERIAAGYTWGVSEDASGGAWITDIVAGFRRLADPAAPPRPLEGAGYRLMHDRQGNLWVATLGEGLWRVADTNVPDPVIERTGLRTGLSSDAVQSVLEDRDGNIWAGTTGGLHRFTRRKLTPIEDVGFVVAAESTGDRGIWAGTTNGLLRFSAASGQWQRQGTGPGVRTLYRDPHGTLWIGTNEGLWRSSGGAPVRVRLPDHYPSAAITTITPSSGGGVWLGYNDWIFRWDGDTLAPFEAPAGAGIERITLARRDRQGRFWLAFDDRHVGYVDEDGAFRALGANDGLADETHAAIYALFEGRDGVMWIGGSGGLSRVADGRVVTVNRENGLPGTRVWAIVEDDDGDLWLSVDRGLVHLTRDEFAAAAADRGHRVQYKLYDTSDGLAGAPLGSIRAARAADGRLWFVRGGGLTLVEPRALHDDRPLTPAPLRIEAAVANERRFSATPQTALPPGTKRLQISYTALTLTAANKIRFRYRLDGFDTDWVDAGTRRVAFYTNLSPRDYRFQVEADTDDGRWNRAITTWAFAIQPAFYQTNWFYASCVALAGLVVWGAWQGRLRLVRRQFSMVLAERARLSREIHDTLLQSLVGVALQVDAISNTLDSSSSAARHQLVRIRRQVEAYIRDARQSIWDLRSPVLETHDLHAALREFGKRATVGKTVRFAASITGTPRRCPAKVENQLLRIGQEAITNAVRHADARRIHLELKFDDRAVALRVSDDGRGFDCECPAADADRHYGLATMRERAEELGGQFTLDAATGRGTEVLAIVPLASNV